MIDPIEVIRALWNFAVFLAIVMSYPSLLLIRLWNHLKLEKTRLAALVLLGWFLLFAAGWLDSQASQGHLVWFAQMVTLSLGRPDPWDRAARP
jgi:hypothetical protein